MDDENRNPQLRQDAATPHGVQIALATNRGGVAFGYTTYEEAEALYQRAMTIFERVYGPENMEIALRCVLKRANTLLVIAHP